ncbi:MAG TPA: hypothetical protein VGQ83_43585 [Polyangia bacterium]|jgi:hypothetical protein
MAEIEIGPLSDRLSDEELKELAGALERLGAPMLPRTDDSHSSPVGDIDDDVLTEFLDRLEAHDAACEVYLPVEFDGRVEVADMRVGSAVQLLEVLDEIKADLEIDEDEADDEDDDDDYGAVLNGQLRECWRFFYAGCNATLERHLPLHVKA